MPGQRLFKPKEIKDLLLTGFVLSLIFFFFKWRTTDLTIQTGIAFFLATFVFVMIVTTTARALQKIVAKKIGYEGSFSNTLPGMAITLAMSFFSFGLLPLLSPGEIKLEHKEHLSLGKRFRYGVNYKDMSKVAIVSIATYIVFVIILKAVFASTDNFLFEYFTMICILLAFFSILPIPSYEGIKIFAKSRIVYSFLFLFVLTYGILVLFTKMFIIIIPLFIAIILTIIFFMQIEKSTL